VAVAALGLLAIRTSPSTSPVLQPAESSRFRPGEARAR
jgi:hypothetical protein